MRIEEANKGRYNKYPDLIDSKLIRIINRYFTGVPETNENIVDVIVDEVTLNVKKNLLAILPDITAANNISTMSLSEDKVAENSVLLTKSVNLENGKSKEYLMDNGQSFSLIEISDDKKKYTHYNGYTKMLFNDVEIILDTYIDSKSNNIVISFKNTGNSDVSFTFTVYS